MNSYIPYDLVVSEKRTDSKVLLANVIPPLHPSTLYMCTVVVAAQHYIYVQ